MKKVILIVVLFVIGCVNINAQQQQCSSIGEESIFINSPVTNSYGITMMVSEQSDNPDVISRQDDQWRSWFPNSFFTQSGLTAYSSQNYQMHGNPGPNIYRVMTRNIVTETNHCFGIMAEDGLMINSSSLENNAPKPTNNSNGLTTNYQSYVENLGNCNTLNSLYFEFKNPLNGFGAWFGDLEGRIDSVPIRIRLFDSLGNRIGNDFVVNESEFPYGNGTTRWIGFKSNSNNVKSMLVIVGSDGSDDGKCNHLSFVGGTKPSPHLRQHLLLLI